MSETMELLVLYGRALGLSLPEMEKIADNAGIVTEGMTNDNPGEVIEVLAGEHDPKTLWLGAVIYGYVLDTCTFGDVEQEVSP